MRVFFEIVIGTAIIIGVLVFLILGVLT